MTVDPKKLISGIPSDPGVYLMKDTDGKILYVGKAGNLKKRVSSYFAGNGRHDIKTRVLLKKVVQIETIITKSEKEALIFEANLIKKHKPRYNVNLKDDKRYPILRLDIKHPYPNLTVVRKMQKDGAVYFGPFSSSRAMHGTLKTIHKTFKLRKCKTKEFRKRSRPCLNYQMGSCLGPCCLELEPGAYENVVRDVTLFLKGRTPDLIRNIKEEMLDAAESMDFEKAADLRDRMLALERTLEKQVSVSADFKDRDVVAYAGSYEFSMITLLSVRNGFLLGSRNFPLDPTLSGEAEILRAFVRQYYENAPFIPKEILVSAFIEESSLLEDWLGSIKGQNVSIRHPQRGEKARLLKIAVRNAEAGLNELASSREANRDLLARLKERLKMNSLPCHIECFDNSNFSGKNMVSGMVVFKNGKPDKSSYRKYRIKTVDKPDDYACMEEVLKRRFGKGEASKPFPDLLLVDGGKGQLNIALAALKSLGIDPDFQVAGIAKKDEKQGETVDKIYLPGRSNPVNFSRRDGLILFLQRIRDEAHRFAVTFHRKRRAAASKRSELDDIPGIGEKRRKTLLRHFGSIKKIRSATVEELSALPGFGIAAAKALHRSLNGEKS